MSGIGHQHLRLTLAVVALIPSLCQGELSLLYDNGQTRSLAPCLETFQPNKPPTRTLVSARPPLGAAEIEQLLPIRSPNLKPGPVQPRAIKRPFTRPFFLTGADSFSRQWLSAHRDRLLEIAAVGMLVQAETVQDLRAVAALANGLPILPASASDIAEALDLSHYPVLITPQGIEQ